MARNQQYTPEQKAAKAAYMRAYNARKKAAETPEQKAERRAKRLVYERKRSEEKRDYLNAKQRERRAADRERFRETNRRYYRRHREKAYLASLDAGKRYRVKVRLEALRHYGGERPVCVCCGESTYEFLALDHINGGGNAHRKSIRPTSVQSMYEWARRNGYPPIFQVLCHNCNMAKGFYGECPHTVLDDAELAQIRRWNLSDLI